jgi:hypothetical protein
MIDLKGSRRYSVKNRDDIQNFIYGVCTELNGVFRDSLERDSGFSAGDEIQGLFSSPVAAYLYYRWFSMLVHPVKLRAGIGVGTWDIRIDEGGTTAQDGQVYYRAREAIERADELDGYNVLYRSGGRIDPAINSLIGGASGIGSRLNAYQNELMLIAELLSPITAKGAPDADALSNLYELMQKKRKIDFYEAENPKPLIEALPEGRIIPTPVYADEPGSSFYVTSGKPRGLPSKIAFILGITRQSVEKTLKTANIYTARNMTISAIKAMTAE